MVDELESGDGLLGEGEDGDRLEEGGEPAKDQAKTKVSQSTLAKASACDATEDLLLLRVC